MTLDTVGKALRSKSNELFGQLFNDSYATNGGAIDLRVYHSGSTYIQQ